MLAPEQIEDPPSRLVSDPRVENGLSELGCTYPVCNGGSLSGEWLPASSC